MNEVANATSSVSSAGEQCISFWSKASPDTLLGVIGLILGLIALIAPFALYFLEIRKRIDELTRGQEGVLNREQAVHLTELYLDSIQSHLSKVISHYFGREFQNRLESRNLLLVQEDLQDAYRNVVTNSIRQMVSSFKLRGNVAYDEILSQVSEAEVDKAIKLMVSAFQEAVRDGLTTAEVEPRARAVLRVANKEGRRMIKERIAKIYSEA